MEDLIYFIKKFIASNRQERWLYLSQRKWEKFADFSGLEKDLNEKCTLVEENIEEKFENITQTKQIVTGCYCDYWTGISTMSPISLEDIDIYGLYGSILICRDKKISFFFQHEGWMWVCKE